MAIPDKSIKTYRSWVVFTALLTFFLIVFGGAVRVTDSGMACPDWPFCYGRLIPFPAPESGYTVAGQHYSWWQVLLEWGHRLGAKIVGILMLVLLVWGTKLRKVQPRVFKTAVVAFVLLVTQVILGGVTVMSANVHWSVAMHLGNALLFLAALSWLLMVSSRSPESTGIETGQKVRATQIAMTGLIFITMIMGAMVSSAHAGAACGGLFSCYGQWLPDDFQQLLHMKHRFLALLTFVGAIVYVVLAKREHAEIRSSARKLKVMILLQVVLGIVLLYSFRDYPAYYQVLSVFHLAWGTLVFTVSLVGIGKTRLGVRAIKTKGVPWH